MASSAGDRAHPPARPAPIRRREEAAISARRSRTWVSGGLSCLALLGLTAGGLGAGVSAASPVPPLARSVAALAGRPAVPAPGESSSLDGVTCTSAASCWAVGSYTRGSTDFNQALRWNGRRWTRIPVPGRGNNATDAATGLNGVTCVTPASCWAVGSLGRRDGSEHNQVVHWNGRAWSPVSVPDPGATTTTTLNELYGVSCAAPASCWAVGARSSDAGFEHNQVMHWNGRKWSLVTVPDLGGLASTGDNELFGVSCPARASCWAVGTSSQSDATPQLNQVLHWNGRRWSRVSVPTPRPKGLSVLSGVSCPSPSSGWAVGGYVIASGGANSTITVLNQALHWDGRRWSLVAVPDQDGTSEGAGNQLIDVSCTSPASCWAVGSSGNVGDKVIGGTELNQAMHWNGRKWSLAATPDPGGTGFAATNLLIGVSCASAASCWAVGDTGPGGANEALRWNGRRWSAG